MRGRWWLIVALVLGCGGCGALGGDGGDGGGGAPNDPGSACASAEGSALADVSAPRTVVGDGTPQSCTSRAFVDAVAKGGVITFDCGPAPHTIALEETAKIFNDTGPEIVIDGGGLITLDGQGQRRILYQNTCDQAQRWTTPMCQDQDHPRLTLQRLTFVRGDASGEDPDGGGAVFVRGGRLRVLECAFYENRCDAQGPDVGGGALRVLSQHAGLPVVIARSTFGEAGRGNVCANGGALSSIGVSMEVVDSVFTANEAIGSGANPARQGTPGGGSGGAIYNDGNTFHLKVCRSTMTDNTAREGGGAIFFVSNDRTGTLRVEGSTLRDNPSQGFETQGLPGIFVLAAETPAPVRSTLE